MNADDFDIHVEKIDTTEDFRGQKRRKKKKKKKNQTTDSEASDHFDEIAHAAERVHAVLKKKKSPYRFCVYRDGSEIYIDIVMLDPRGSIQKTLKKNITHREFASLVKNIETLDGLLIDFTA